MANLIQASLTKISTLFPDHTIVQTPVYDTLIESRCRHCSHDVIEIVEGE